jgi:hypothetical protein
VPSFSERKEIARIAAEFLAWIAAELLAWIAKSRLKQANEPA